MKTHYLVLFIAYLSVAAVNAAEPLLFDTFELSNDGIYLDSDSGQPANGWAVSYGENGKLILKVHLQAGVKHGLEKAWDEEGNPLYEVFYDHGQPQSYLSRWYGSESAGSEQDEDLWVCSDAELMSESGYQALCGEPAEEEGSTFKSCNEVDCGINL